MAAQKTHSELSTAPMWCPSRERVEKTNLTAFFRFVRERGHSNSSGYARLHRWSIEKPEQFWQSVWEFCGVVASRPAERRGRRFRPVSGRPLVSRGTAQLRRELAPLSRRSAGARLLERGGLSAVADFCGALRRRSLALAAVLKERGVKSGDRIAGIPAQHARSGDRHAGRGEPGGDLVVVLARFRRAGRGRPLRPDRAARFSFAADGYVYDGRRFDTLERLRTVLPQLPSVEHVVVVPYLQRASRILPGIASRLWPDVIDRPAAGDHRFRATAVRSSALHSLFVGHDGPAEVHHALGRRRARCSI